MTKLLLNKKNIQIISIIVFLAGVTISALSYSNGITGRTNSGCTCHGSSNSNTSLSLSSASGNYTVRPGESANFTVTVAHSTQPKAGVNIAVKTTQTGETNIGSLTPGSGSGLSLSNSELHHSSPKSITSGQASFDFSWTAPNTPGIYYLRAAGNAVNDNGGNSGDQWNLMSSQAITVPGVDLQSLTGGETICQSTQTNIQWTTVGVTNVKIELSSDGGSSFPTILVSSTDASAGSWTWNIPANLSAGNQYRIKVSDVSDNTLNDVSTNNFSVGETTAITLHPQSQLVCTKQQVSFSTTATGNNLTYQWRKNSVNISGATQSTFTINNVQLIHAGTYDVVVSGTCGSPATSSSAVLTVDESPTISSNPVSQAECPGANVTFSVTASGKDIVYQWLKNGNDIAGATTNTYAVNNISSSDSGAYSVRVSGSCQPPVVSTEASLSILTEPSVLNHPQNQIACNGSSAQFSVNAAGSNLSYQWRKNGTPIQGAVSQNYLLENVTANDAGGYDVVINGNCNSQITSNKAILEITQKPSIISQTESKTLTERDSLIISVEGSSNTDGIQWKKNNISINGATSNIYIIPSIALSDSGTYSCVLSNECGETKCNDIIVNVLPWKSGPSIFLTQNAIDFGVVDVSKSSETSIQIKNNGDQKLIVSNVIISGTNAAEFEILSGGGNFELEAEAVRDLTFKFSPVNAGVRNATLNIQSNSKNNPELPLTGFGGVIDLSSSVQDIDFGDVGIDSMSVRKFTISNNGNYSVNILNIQFTGKDPDQFTFDSTLIPVTLEPTVGKAEFPVNYKPTRSVEAFAEMKIQNSANTELIINLRGNSILSSVQDNLFISDIRLYPNPGNGNITFDFNIENAGMLQIQIVDMLGKTVRKFGLNYYQAGKSALVWNTKDDSGNNCESGYYRLIVLGEKVNTSYQFLIMD